MRASTVDVEGGDAEQVGAPGVRAFILQLLQCFPARVAVAVVRADRNRGEMRRNASEERRNGRGLAAVVAGLEQIGGEVARRQ